MGAVVISVRVRYICDIHDPSDPRGTFEGDMGTALTDAADTGWRTTTTPTGRTVHLCPECWAARFAREPREAS